MSKGNYSVNNSQNANDASYRSCLCAMLVFMALCGIILLVAYLTWPKNESNVPRNKENFDDIESEVLGNPLGRGNFDNPNQRYVDKRTENLTTTTSGNGQIAEGEKNKLTTTLKPENRENHKSSNEVASKPTEDEAEEKKVPNTMKPKDSNTGKVNTLNKTIVTTTPQDEAEEKNVTNIVTSKDSNIGEGGILNKTIVITTPQDEAEKKKGTNIVTSKDSNTEEDDTSNETIVITTPQDEAEEKKVLNTMKPKDSNTGKVNTLNKTIVTTTPQDEAEKRKGTNNVTSKDSNTEEDDTSNETIVITTPQDEAEEKKGTNIVTSEDSNTEEDDTSTETIVITTPQGDEKELDRGIVENKNSNISQPKKDETTIKSSEKTNPLPIGKASNETDKTDFASNAEKDIFEASNNKNVNPESVTITSKLKDNSNNSQVKNNKDISEKADKKNSVSGDHSYKPRSLQSNEDSSTSINKDKENFDPAPTNEYYGDYSDEENISTETNKIRQAISKQAILKNTTNICDTNTCKSTVSRMLGLMNLNVELCDNFYEYSCGSMLADEATVYVDTIWSEMSKEINGIDNSMTSTKAHLKLKTFYKSCIKHEKDFEYRMRVDKAKEVIKNAGNFFLDNSANLDTDDLTKLVAKLILMKSLPLMEVNINVDKETSKYLLQVSIPDKRSNPNIMSQWSTLFDIERNCFISTSESIGDESNLEDVYNVYRTCRETRDSYSLAVNNSLVELEFYAKLHQYNATQGIQRHVFHIEGIFDLLSIISGQAIQEDKINQNYETVKISDLQATCGVINWELFFKELTGYKHSSDTSIQIYFYDKIKKIMTALKDLANQEGEVTLYNSLLVIYATDIYQNTVVPKNKENRADYCLKLSAELFPDVATHMYFKFTSREHFKYQANVKQIFNILKENLKNEFKELSWTSSESSLVDKLDKLEVHFATDSDVCISEAALDVNYDDTVVTDDNFASNLISLNTHQQKHLFALAGTAFNKSDMFCYFVNAFDVEPKTFYAESIIAVPYGIMRKLSNDVPGYILMARVGIHLAEAIGRHFDSVGIRISTQLSEEAYEAYTGFSDAYYDIEKTRSIYNQKMNFSATNLTLNNVIVDNAAIRMVSEVYNKLENDLTLPWIGQTFSHEKVFFISVAQEFCRRTTPMDYTLSIYETDTLPPALRVENMFANSKRFVDAFECPAGTVMNSGEMAIYQFPYLDE